MFLCRKNILELKLQYNIEVVETKQADFALNYFSLLNFTLTNLQLSCCKNASADSWKSFFNIEYQASLLLTNIYNQKSHLPLLII